MRKLPRYTKIELVEMLQDYYNLYEKVPTQRAINKNPSYPSATTFISHFETWNNAIEAAGLEPRTRSTASYTDEELIYYLKDLAERLGRTPVDGDIRLDTHTPSASTYRKRFGSLRAACRLAGIHDRPKSYQYSDEELLEAIRDAKDIFGWVPSSEEWQTQCAGFPAISTYYRRFPDMSWEEIVRMSGAMNPPPKKEGDENK